MIRGGCNDVLTKTNDLHKCSLPTSAYIVGIYDGLEKIRIKISIWIFTT